MHQLFECEGEGGLETGDAEGRAVELNIFEGGLMRRVIGGNRFDGAIRKTGD